MLDKNRKHDVEIVVDRLVMRDGIRSRLSDSVEAALAAAEGRLLIVTVPRDGEKEQEMSFLNVTPARSTVCPSASWSRMFSFNNPAGACPKCAGLGDMQRVAVRRLIPHPELSLRQGAIQVNGFKTLDAESWSGPLFESGREAVWLHDGSASQHLHAGSTERAVLRLGDDLRRCPLLWQGAAQAEGKV